jgi:hypothetical protein
MPIDKSIEVIPETPSLVGLAVRLTASQVTQTAKEQCANLTAQTKNIITTQSNLDILRKRYNIGRSYFSNLADWYGNLSWWKKLGMGITVLVAAAGALAVGALAGVAVGVLCASFIIAFYVFTSYLLQNHYKLTSVRDQRFCDDIVEMEALLGDSVRSMNAIGREFDAALELLASENVKLAKDIETFEAQISVFSDQVLNLTQTITQLRATNDSLALMHQELLNVNQSFEKTHVAIDEHSAMLDGASRDLVDTSRNLADGVERMRTIDKNFEKNQLEIEHLHETVRKHIAILTLHANEDRIRRDKLCQSFQDSGEAKPEVDANFDQTMEMYRDLDKRMDQLFLNEDARCLEIEKSIAESTRVLAWIERLEHTRNGHTFRPN